MLKRDRILQSAKKRLVEKFGDQVQQVVLFGSRVWGKPKPWSDYDFVVVVKGEYDWHLVHSIRSEMAEIDLDFNIVTQSLIISESELKDSLKGKEPIIAKALSHGIYA